MRHARFSGAAWINSVLLKINEWYSPSTVAKETRATKAFWLKERRNMRARSCSNNPVEVLPVVADNSQ
jgi:hypothetical protein